MLPIPGHLMGIRHTVLAEEVIEGFSKVDLNPVIICDGLA